MNKQWEKMTLEDRKKKLEYLLKCRKELKIAREFEAAMKAMEQGE